jgi:hypothetical protein
MPIRPRALRNTAMFALLLLCLNFVGDFLFVSYARQLLAKRLARSEALWASAKEQRSFMIAAFGENHSAKMYVYTEHHRGACEVLSWPELIPPPTAFPRAIFAR